MVVHTSYANEDALLAAVMAGACSYVIKDLDTAGLIEAIVPAAELRSPLDAAAVERALPRVSRAVESAGLPPSHPTPSPDGSAVVGWIRDRRTDAEIAPLLDVDEQ